MCDYKNCEVCKELTYSKYFCFHKADWIKNIDNTTMNKCNIKDRIKQMNNYIKLGLIRNNE
jgi:LytS/YehU family sensor histidine kinase